MQAPNRNLVSESMEWSWINGLHTSVIWFVDGIYFQIFDMIHIWKLLVPQEMVGTRRPTASGRSSAFTCLQSFVSQILKHSNEDGREIADGVVTEWAKERHNEWVF